MSEGREAIRTFWIRNTGTEPLIVSRIASGRGRVASSFDATIPPGGKGRIDLKFDTRHPHGRVKKRAIVLTNDPESPKVLIEVIMDVR